MFPALAAESSVLAIREREKVRTVLPVRSRLIDELEVSLVDERRRGDGAVSRRRTAIPGEMSVRDQPKLVVDHRDQAIERVTSTAAKGA
jgi:hypothetical protein